jgi:hypothetical protein
VTVHVYAITEASAAAPTTAGIDGAPVTIEDLNGLGAVVSVLDRPPSPASEEAVLAHARVVDAVAREGAAVLPVRFGRGYEDSESVRRELQGRAGELSESLERVRGCVEVALRVLAPEEAAASPASPPPPAASGREYMRSRLAAVRHAEAVADELHRPLAALSRASTRSVLATPRLLLTGAYLVPRSSLDAFRARVDELQRSRPDLGLACTGPWPPYSFTAGEPAQ